MLVFKKKKAWKRNYKCVNNDGLHVTMTLTVKVLQLVLINYWSLFVTLFSALKQTPSALDVCDFEWVMVDFYGAFLVSTEVVYL